MKEETLRNHPRLSISVFLFFLLIIFHPVAYPDDTTDRVDALFSQWDHKDSPGCALAVIRNGRIIYEQGYGMANLELGVPISPRSVFYIGSTSKQFVAAGIGLLAIEGKLSLDDDIRKYIPEMPEYGTRITIRNLIHHTSGLRDFLTLLGIAGIDFGTYHEPDVLELIRRQKALNFEPGSEYLYSNSGYFLLSVIVHRASGKTLREFAEDRIFQPLGMNNSHFHDDYTRLIPDRASGYYPAGRKKFKNFLSTFDNVGSGGLFTSVRDLFLWDQNFYHHEVGGRELFDLLHTKGTLADGGELDYAFALTIGSYKGLKTVSHGGALGGYRAALTRFPDQKFTVIVLANLSTIDPSKLAGRVAELYLTDHMRGEEPEKKAPPRPTIELPENKLKKITGTYINLENGSSFRVRLRKGKLEFSGPGQRFLMAALSDNRFILDDIPDRVELEFEHQDAGKTLLLHIRQAAVPDHTLRRYERARLSPEKLREYVGEFYSEELDTRFRIALKKNRLYFTHRNAPAAPLAPTCPDYFTLGNLRIIFQRNAGAVSSFAINAGRVRNLRFVKQ